MKKYSQCIQTKKRSNIFLSILCTMSLVAFSVGGICTTAEATTENIQGTANAVQNSDTNNTGVFCAISAGSWHTVALKNDGTVVAMGQNTEGQCNVNEWEDIVAVSAGYWNTIGLKRAMML